MFLLSEDAWEIKDVKEKGKGVFTKKDIAPGVVIGDYLGKVIRIQDEQVIDSGKNFYSMYYSDEALIFPNLKKQGIHLLNHSCTPNCWMYTYKGHTLFFALRKIFAGEELTVSYLLSPQDKECKPCNHLCECNGIFCFQTMHLSEKRYEIWEAFHEKEEKRTTPEKVVFGEELPMLSSYPKNIPDNPIYILFGSSIVAPLQISSQVMPSVEDIRKMIRESGKTIHLVNLRIQIEGILENLIISTPVKKQ